MGCAKPAPWQRCTTSSVTAGCACGMSAATPAPAGAAGGVLDGTHGAAHAHAHPTHLLDVAQRGVHARGEHHALGPPAHNAGAHEHQVVLAGDVRVAGHTAVRVRVRVGGGHVRSGSAERVSTGRRRRHGHGRLLGHVSDRGVGGTHASPRQADTRGRRRRGSASRHRHGAKGTHVWVSFMALSLSPVKLACSTRSVAAARQTATRTRKHTQASTTATDDAW
jgi:hypothetical protein